MTTAACRAGELEQVLALSAIQYMSAERSYVPWYSLASNMGYMRRMLITGAGSDLLKVLCLAPHLCIHVPVNQIHYISADELRLQLVRLYMYVLLRHRVTCRACYEVWSPT